jgi:competence protein ComEC
LLINGGPSPSALSDALGRRLPFGGSQLDYLLVASAAEEQVAALPAALDHVGFGRVLWAGSQVGGYSAGELQKRLAEERIPILAAQPGQVLDLGRGARLEVLAASSRGAVLLLEWGRFRALLPIGLDFESLDSMMKDPGEGPVSVLMLAHGGHATLNPPDWIERWGPQLALLSVGSGNPDGLPHPETLQALGGVQLLRTDRNGWIELSTDGERLWVEVEKK